MLLRVCSDLHLEFTNFNKITKIIKTMLPPDSRDSESILCIAGDLGLMCNYTTSIKPALRELSTRFKAVCYVLGNHEYYNSANWNNYRTFWLDKSIPNNVFILEDNFKLINNVCFIGSTLWTNFDNGNPLSMVAAERGMTDFRSIKYETCGEPYCRDKSINANMSMVRHEVSAKFIFDAIRIHKQEGREVVCITHHAPSYQSVSEIFAGDLLNDAFASDLDEKIISARPNIWIHGHMHSSFDYNIGSTRVLTNPFGYLNVSINKGYEHRLFVEV